ncbi:MAG: HAMP domain-containing histidine kinase [Candidatus Gracilibacteria bacterium]|nr:HAMP domain-containing histidine kinase [Candidatus Gracilibacteria bacterium]
MTIAKKFIISLILSIFFIATINIFAFYVFYTSYLEVYFTEKINSREKITLSYINKVIEQQTIDEIGSIFSDTEIEIYELFEKNNGEILLSNESSIDLIVKYLVKNKVTPEYIEEIIPVNNVGKVLKALQDKNSPEYGFLNKLTYSIIITNIFSIIVIIFFMLIFTRKTISPIKKATQNIQNSEPGKEYRVIQYHNKNDEIGLLIDSINVLNKKLNLQEDIRSRLLADISHELKTPITSIQCYLEGISDGVIKLDQKNLNSITDEMKRLIVMVNKIMDYEKQEREKLDLVKKDYNIYDMIIGVVETHKKRLKENKQRIKVNGDINQMKDLDNDLFRQLVHNLIGNFLKYAGKNSILKININKTYIEFSDNGKGIKMSEIPFLTEKFYQGNIEKTATVEKRGIGVGLSITKKIIDSHGWKYEIRSDTDKGFHFKIIY